MDTYEIAIKRKLVALALDIDKTPNIELPSARDLMARILFDTDAIQDYYEAKK